MSLQSQSKDLTELNTMALPCVARQFYRLNTDDDVLEFFSSNQGEVLVLGGGSNLILPPQLDVPVVQVGQASVETIAEDASHVVLRAGAAMLWDDLVSWAVARQYFGLENLSLIPGTVGAAPVQNIGAYGVELKETLIQVRVFDTRDKCFKSLSNDECNFAYRDSVFKRQRGRYVILDVTIRLNKRAEFCLNYGELKAMQSDTDLSLSKVRDKVIQVRSAKLPDPKSIPNTGSFFKNPVVGKAQYEKTRESFPDLVAFPLDQDTYKLAAGWMIDRLGLKGQSIEAAKVHERQALVLINTGGASQRDILELAHMIQKRVFEAFGVALEIEPVVL